MRISSLETAYVQSPQHRGGGSTFPGRNNRIVYSPMVIIPESLFLSFLRHGTRPRGGLEGDDEVNFVDGSGIAVGSLLQGSNVPSSYLSCYQGDVIGITSNYSKLQIGKDVSSMRRINADRILIQI